MTDADIGFFLEVFTGAVALLGLAFALVSFTMMDELPPNPTRLQRVRFAIWSAL